MADTLRNPNDRKYLGHTIDKPKKWVNLITRKAKKYEHPAISAVK